MLKPELDKSKIRLMARLSIYERKFGVHDRRKNNYYKWDYIYFRNLWTRLGVFFGCMIITLFYVLKLLLIEQVDVFALDLKQEAAKIGFYTLAALVVYTIIGTIVASGEYKKSKSRLDAYYAMLGRLDGWGDNGGQYYEDEDDEYGGENGYPLDNVPSEDVPPGYMPGRAARYAAPHYEEDEYDIEFDKPEGVHYGVMSRGERVLPDDSEPPMPPPPEPPRKATFSQGAKAGSAEEERSVDILKRLRGDNDDGRA